MINVTEIGLFDGRNVTRFYTAIFIILVSFHLTMACSGASFDSLNQYSKSKAELKTESNQRNDPEFYLELDCSTELSDIAACSAPDGTFYMSVTRQWLPGFSVFHFFEDGSYTNTDLLRPELTGTQVFCNITSLLADDNGWIATGLDGSYLVSNPPSGSQFPNTVAYNHDQVMQWSKSQYYVATSYSSQLIQTAVSQDYIFLGTNGDRHGIPDGIVVSRFEPGYTNEITYKYSLPSASILVGLSICPAIDDGVWVTGKRSGPIGFLLKLSPTLEIEESVTINYTYGLQISAAHQCEDGSLLLAGISNTNLAVILHLDQSLNVLWAKRVFGIYSINDILPFNDTSFVVAASGNGMRVMKWTYEGSLLWTRQFTSGEQHDETCAKFMRLNQNKFVLCGLKPSTSKAVVIQTQGDLSIARCPAESNVSLAVMDAPIVISNLPLEMESKVTGVSVSYYPDTINPITDEICYDAPTETPLPTDTPTNTPTLIPTGTPTHLPTDTPTNTPTLIPTGTPTHLPTDTPTNTPTHIPSDTPTDTPTSLPTKIPTPEKTPSPAATSTPTQTPNTCHETGVKLWMPDHKFFPNDLCSCTVTVCNATSETLQQYPLFVVLYTCGIYLFAPSFSDYDHYLNSYPEFPPGETPIDIISEFVWPDTTGTSGTCTLYAALVNPELTTIYGAIDTWDLKW